MTQDYRKGLAERLMELANLSAGAFVIGSLLNRQVDVIALLVGGVIFAVLYVTSYKLYK